MATKLFVGNLPYTVDDTGLNDLFASFGTVASAKVIIDRDTNRSKGFGFVEFDDDQAAKAAIDELNGKELEGRAIVVNEARPPERRERSSGGGGGFRGNDRRGGGGRQY